MSRYVQSAVKMSKSTGRGGVYAQQETERAGTSHGREGGTGDRKSG